MVWKERRERGWERGRERGERERKRERERERRKEREIYLHRKEVLADWDSKYNAH